jgi:hypothetical protein
MFSMPIQFKYLISIDLKKMLQIQIALHFLF